MINNSNTPLLIVFLLCFSSCGKVYNVPDANALAKQHQKVAILMPRVSIKAPKRSGLSDHQAIEQIESENFQREIYFWFLQQKMKNKIDVEIQDVDLTNSLLEKDYDYINNQLTPEEICTILEVDGLIRSKFSMTQYSQGLAIVSTIVSGVWASAHKVDVIMELYDKNIKGLIWMFKHDLDGSLRSSPSDVVSQLMYYASKKLPYLD